MEITNLKDQLKKLKMGEHICFSYKNKEEMFSTVVSFMLQGLKGNEKCLYIADSEESFKTFKNISELNKYIESGQFVMLTKEEAYLKHGEFNPE